MSWIFGIIGNYSEPDIKAFKSVHSKPIHVEKYKNVYVAAGGLKDTCFYNYSSEKQDKQIKGWIVCGIGIKYNGQDFSIMSNDDWESFLSKEKVNFNQLNGHFVGIKWNEREVFCFTDQLGFRNLYLAKMKQFTVFSTRPDWIAKIKRDCTIDFFEFGAQWLLINQLSPNSLLSDTIRLSQGGKATCTQESISFENNPWDPDLPLGLPEEDIYSLLERLMTFPMKTGKMISLALSGGFDSRVLLSVLLSSPYNNYCLHSFGDSENPDRKIAKEISKNLDIEHTFFDITIPDKNTCLKLVDEYIGNTMSTRPASAFLYLQFFKKLYQNNKIIIDGGMGEIARGRNLNRFLIRGRDALSKGDIIKIRSYLNTGRWTFFTKETLKKMNNGADQQIELILQKMPAVKKTEISYWLDLFVIRTRFPNLIGSEQSYADSMCLTYMPFTQPSCLKKVFETPQNYKKKGEMFRKIIHKNKNPLELYPLVKDQTYYPFKLPNIPVSILLKLKKKLGYAFREKAPALFLNRMSEFVQDTAHSSQVKNCEFYDYPSILKTAEEFFKGNKTYTDKLDWWLSFEIWRQKVYNYQ